MSTMCKHNIIINQCGTAPSAKTRTAYKLRKLLIKQTSHEIARYTIVVRVADAPFIR